MTQNAKPDAGIPYFASAAQDRPTIDTIMLVARRTFAMLQPPPVSPPTPEIVDSVEFVKYNFAADIRLADIANAASLSRFHFLRRFRKEAGMTPGAFLQRYRIVRAMELLLVSNRPICEVARQVGYKNPAAFSRAFLKIAGTRPYLFRQARVQNGNAV